MAPLPITNTARLFIDYQGVTGAHTTLIRLVGSASAAGAGAVAQEVCDVLAPFWTNEVSIIGARFAAVNDPNSFPIPEPSMTPTGGVNTADFTDAKFMSLIGRSSGGRRARVFVYNTNVVMDDDYRRSSSDLSPAEDALLLYFQNQNAIVAIDGNPVTWYPYINTGMSAYWQKAYRRTR